MKHDLKVDWASHAAAKYACENWHYSKTLPVGKLVKAGVWENGRFVGVVIFAWGMNANLGKPYGLKMVQCCELVRVALNKHESPVSRIVKISLMLLKKKNPGIRLVVSFADPEEGHHGGIYQAGNWIFTGDSPKGNEWVLNGRRLNRRAYTGGSFGRKKMELPAGAIKRETKGKHRYLMPLDKEMRAKVLPLAKPYPKRPKLGDACDQQDSGGATPTRTLHG